MDDADDHAFGFMVDFRHIIVGRFLRDRQDVDVLRGAVDDAAGAARCLDGGIEHRMHGGAAIRIEGFRAEYPARAELEGAYCSE